MADDVTRRDFHKSIVGGAALVGFGAAPAIAMEETPALTGGKPVRTAPFPSWPRIAANDEKNWDSVLREGKWCRLDGDRATEFEKAWAKTLGVEHCTATSCGTTALSTTLNALDVSPGDEVIVSTLYICRDGQRCAAAIRAARLCRFRHRDVSNRCD